MSIVRKAMLLILPALALGAPLTVATSADAHPLHHGRFAYYWPRESFVRVLPVAWR